MNSLLILLFAFYILIILKSFKWAVTIYICLNPYFLDALWLKFPLGIDIGLKLAMGYSIFIAILIKIFIRKQYKSDMTSFKFWPIFLLLGLLLLVNYIINTVPSTNIRTYFDYTINGFFLLFIGFITFTSKKEIEKVLYIVSVFTLIAGIYGIYTFIVSGNPYMEYMVNYARYEIGKNIDYVYGLDNKILRNRVQSFMWHAIAYGGVLSLVAGIWISYIIAKVKNCNVKNNSYYYLFSFISIINLVLAASRSGLLSFFIICLMHLLFLRKKILKFLKVLITLIICYTIVNAFTNKLEKYNEVIYATVFFWEKNDKMHGSSLESRSEQLLYAYYYFMNAPILGHGLGTTKNSIDHKAKTKSIGGAESFWIGVMIDFGLFGICFYVLFFFTLYHEDRLHFRQRKVRIKNSLYGNIIKALTVGYIVFISITGELQTFGFYLLLMGLLLKLNLIEKSIISHLLLNK